MRNGHGRMGGRCRVAAADGYAIHMLKVILESHYAGDVARNLTYARRALRDSLLRGEAPLASHLLYTQEGVLDDTVPEERKRGIEAGFAWRADAKKTVVYLDYGMSKGMEVGIDDARKRGIECEYRVIGKNGEPLAYEAELAELRDICKELSLLFGCRAVSLYWNSKRGIQGARGLAAVANNNHEQVALNLIRHAIRSCKAKVPA